MDKEVQELVSKALWMGAFEETLKACKERGLSSEATLVGMINIVTSVLRQLIEKREEEN